MSSRHSSVRQELLAERAGLTELVKETQHVVGAIAKQGYQELNRRPIAAGHSASPLRWGNGGVLLKTYKTTRPAATPETPLPGNDAYVVASTATGSQQKMHPSLPLKLPAHAKWVTVGLASVNAEDRVGSQPEFTVGMNGSTPYASTGYHRYDAKLAGHIEGDPGVIDDPSRRYTTPEGLRDDYARAYTGALAVAGLVSVSLEAVHGIETPAASIPGLMDAWQEMRASEAGAISPGLTQFLPR